MFAFLLRLHMYCEGQIPKSIVTNKNFLLHEIVERRRYNKPISKNGIKAEG